MSLAKRGTWATLSTLRVRTKSATTNSQLSIIHLHFSGGGSRWANNIASPFPDFSGKISTAHHDANLEILAEHVEAVNSLASREGTDSQREMTTDLEKMIEAAEDIEYVSTVNDEGQG